MFWGTPLHKETGVPLLKRRWIGTPHHHAQPPAALARSKRCKVYLLRSSQHSQHFRVRTALRTAIASQRLGFFMKGVSIPPGIEKKNIEYWTRGPYLGLTHLDSYRLEAARLRNRSQRFVRSPEIPGRLRFPITALPSQRASLVPASQVRRWPRLASPESMIHGFYNRVTPCSPCLGEPILNTADESTAHGAFHGLIQVGEEPRWTPVSPHQTTVSWILNESVLKCPISLNKFCLGYLWHPKRCWLCLCISSKRLTNWSWVVLLLCPFTGPWSRWSQTRGGSCSLSIAAKTSNEWRSWDHGTMGQSKSINSQNPMEPQSHEPSVFFSCLILNKHHVEHFAQEFLPDLAFFSFLAPLFLSETVSRCFQQPSLFNFHFSAQIRWLQ